MKQMEVSIFLEQIMESASIVEAVLAKLGPDYALHEYLFPVSWREFAEAWAATIRIREAARNALQQLGARIPISTVRAFKIVMRNEGGRLCSIARGKASVEYTPGQWIEAPGWLAERGYHLFCFEELRDALNWPFSPNGAEIWEVEAEEVSSILPPPLDLDALAEGRMEPSLTGNAYSWGTIMARRVKLIRRVAHIEQGLVVLSP